MKKFQPAFIQEKEIRELREALLGKGMNPAFIDPILQEEKKKTYFLNDKYQVAISVGEKEPLFHLSIKRLDRESIHDWRDLQEIKNQLIGPDNEAVELYPAEARRVDSSNQYHLYVLSNPKLRFPFGFNARFVSEQTVGKSKQRKFDQES